MLEAFRAFSKGGVLLLFIAGEDLTCNLNSHVNKTSQ